MDFETLVPEQRVDLAIKVANNYYNGRPTGMTDYDYDQLLEKVKEDDPSFNIYRHVIYENDSVKARHEIPLPAIGKIDFKNLEQMATIPDDWVLTPKYDGCSIVVYYDKSGNLRNIITRSDDVTGVVQTKKLRGKVPNKVTPGIHAIFFEALVQEGGRSKANGLINSKYKQDEVDELLTLRPFDVVLYGRILGYKQRMDMTGLDYTCLSLFEAIDLGRQGDEPICRGFPVDGVVVYSNVRPAYSQIYKFYSTQCQSSVVTKVLTPISPDTGLGNVVVEFDTVRIGKTNVHRCGNLGNYVTVCDKKLGVGSNIKVKLAKLTIPQITENTPWVEPIKPVCEHCGSELEEFQGKLICPNIGCHFWENKFEDKYFSVTKDYKGKGWVDEFTVNSEYNLELMAKAEIETGIRFEQMCMNPELMLYFLEPPRLKSSLYEAVKQRVKDWYDKDKHVTLEEVKNLVVAAVYNKNSKAYMEEVFLRLMHVVERLNEIRERLNKASF